METSSSVATVNDDSLPQTEPSQPFLHLVESLVTTCMMSEPWKGIAGMPAANASWAPLFSGKMKDVLDFLDDFEQQVELCGLTEAEKCSMIIHYLDKKMQMLWKNAEGWKDGNWEEFKKSVLEDYPDADKANHFTLQDLERIIVKQRKKDINTFTEFFEYHQRFHSIALSLLANKALSNMDWDRYFWEGLHKSTWHAILRQVENINTDYD